LAEQVGPAGQGELAEQVGPVVQGVLAAQAGRAGQEELVAQAGQAAAGKRPIGRPPVQRAARVAAVRREGRT
jgi:hypothetical protein